MLPRLDVLRFALCSLKRVDNLGNEARVPWWYDGSRIGVGAGIGIGLGEVFGRATA